MHENHRNRLRKKFLSFPDIMEEHEILELLLTYSIPRKNTNDIAHELLERLGSISGVFDASFSMLKEVKGVGDSTALFLKVVSTVIRLYSQDKYKPKKHALSREEVAQILFNKFVCRSEECVAIALLNPKQKLVFCDIIAKGTFGSVNLYSRDLLKLVVNFDARFAIIAHNHPSGIALPSKEDLIVTKELYNLLEMLEISLVDHIIVGRTGSFSIRSKNHGYGIWPDNRRR